MDFSNLLDDKLLELLEAVKAEYEKREYLKKEKEAEAIARKWAAKAAINAVLREWGYSAGYSISIWSREADRRIYFDDTNPSKWKFCLYLSGNKYHAPGYLQKEGVKCWFSEKSRELKELLQAIAQEDWEGDLKVCSLDFQENSIEPCATRLKKYREVLGLV
jgi:hypothetical protein